MFFKLFVLNFVLQQTSVFCLITLLHQQQLQESQLEELFNSLSYAEMDNALNVANLGAYDETSNFAADTELKIQESEKANRVDDCATTTINSAAYGNILSFPCADSSYWCLWWSQIPLVALSNKQLKQNSKCRRQRKCEHEEINFRSLYKRLPGLKRKIQQQNDVTMSPKFEYYLLLELLDNLQNNIKQDESAGKTPTADDVTSATLKPRVKKRMFQHDSMNFPYFSHAAASSYLLDNSNRQKQKISEFTPSISAGALTNLGHFFKDLTKNVHFSENVQLRSDEQKLLEGDHPLRVLQQQMTEEEPTSQSNTANFLNAIRSYRPSQKIRSLVSMNPEGYHGSEFLDPNYMWVGLGK